MALPPAASISIKSTLDLLDGPFSSFASGVTEDRYAFWLGSGISFGRVDGLKNVIARVIEYLRVRVDATNVNCRFNASLNDALGLASLSADEWGRVNLNEPFPTWTDADAISQRLITNYARFLDVSVEGEPEDYLLWCGVDVSGTYANPATEPDVEHLSLGILILEGVASDIASANWDGLIEKAVNQLSANQPILNVYARSDDLRIEGRRARLYKFHGCAVLATSDEANYRSCLVARQSQINAWAAAPGNQLLVNSLENLVSRKATVMMGLSAQDANIQSLFARAAAQLAWPWPGDRPSFVFSENTVGPDQMGLLRNVYGAATWNQQRQPVIDSALIQAYAKPLATGLVLHVLGAKLQHLIGIANSPVAIQDREPLRLGISAIRDHIANSVGDDRLTFLRHLVQYNFRLASVKDGNPPAPGLVYNPITSVPLQQIGAAGVERRGLPEFSTTLGLIGWGMKEGHWSVEAANLTDATGGSFRVSGNSGVSKVFLTSDGHSALLLRHTGVLTDAPENIVIHCSEIVPPLQRSPRLAPGRTGQRQPREFSMTTMLSTATSVDDLMMKFRRETVL